MSEIRVLLVDDEEELVATIQERLELRGITARAVTTGQRALEQVRRHPFDVVVLDLMMPGLAGTDVAETIRRERPATRILLITGHGSRNDELNDLTARGYRILLKPFPIDRLVAMIREAARGQEAEP